MISRKTSEAVNERTALAVKNHDTNEKEKLLEWMASNNKIPQRKSITKPENIKKKKSLNKRKKAVL
ncbi:8527_t:CDS:1, partial [Dentiscutata erythropus]